MDFKRIESRQYSSINELSNDLQLMFDNACLYNEPGSTIYRVKSFVCVFFYLKLFVELGCTFLTKSFN